MQAPITNRLGQLLRGAFPHTPTGQQAEAFELLAEYLAAPTRHHCFVLKGAAGTGKTSLLRAVAEAMRRERRRVVLLAPTGRAAKVATERTGLAASTIHHAIYATEPDGEGPTLALRENRWPESTVFIIDEASMLSDLPPEDYGTRSEGLLRDVLRFCWKGRPATRVLFVGDPVQLPPVGTLRSPALNEKYLREALNLEVTSVNLTEVKRQALESGILRNATEIRSAIAARRLQELPVLFRAPDIEVLETGQDALERYQSLFDPTQPDRVVLLTYSNSVAAQFNQAIRNQLHYEPDLLTESDTVMAVKNYYYKDPRTQKLKFIANGELGTVRRVFRSTRHEAYGREWVEAEVEFPGSEGPESLTALVPLDLLYSKQPALAGPEMRALWNQRRDDRKLAGESVSMKEMRQDPYLSALQLKLGYAVTCHKAQGGQWAHVLVVFEPMLFRTADDQGKPRDLLEALRWTYTAITRAQERLYLIQPPFDIVPQTEER